MINFQTKEAEAWVLPVIQGFVQIEPCRVEVGYEALSPRYEVSLEYGGGSTSSVCIFVQ